MGRLRGCLWLTAGLVVALLAAFVGYMAIRRYDVPSPQTGQGQTTPQVTVVVAAQAVGVRATLTAEDVTTKQVPVDAAPEGSLSTVDDAIGRITLVELYPGEVVLAQRLVDPNVAAASGRLALVVAEDEVLMAFPASDLMSKVGVLKPGDHVDLLFTLDFPDRITSVASGEGGGEKEKVSWSLLQNLTIAAIVGAQDANQQQQGAPQAILLTVSPQDALTLKFVKDSGGVMDMVLRAPGAEQPFETEPVDVDYMINRYQIPTQPGR